MKPGPIKKLIHGVAVTIGKDALSGLWEVTVDSENTKLESGLLVGGCRFRFEALQKAEVLLSAVATEEDQSEFDRFRAVFSRAKERAHSRAIEVLKKEERRIAQIRKEFPNCRPPVRSLKVLEKNGLGRRLVIEISKEGEKWLPDCERWLVILGLSECEAQTICERAEDRWVRVEDRCE
jgi:hypothetical protein